MTTITNNKLTDELLGVYAAYSAWIRSGAPVGGIFKRNAGLCANAYDYFSAIGVDSTPNLEAMHAAFVAAGMDEKLPFNPNPKQYDQEQRSAACHLNQARLAWVAAELQERRRADNAEPVSFDDLRDAVAEMTGGPAMQWGDIHKGHQPVPFINFNSLARIVDKFRVAPPAPVVPEDENGQPAGFAKWANRNFATNPVGTMTLSYCEDAWRAALLQGSQPVSNRDELPVSEIECDICGFKSTDPDGAHYCCEDNSND